VRLRKRGQLIHVQGADRAVQDTLAGAQAARLRRIIIIVIHYRNCDSDIIIIATR
jgi:hypothetical protein